MTEHITPGRAWTDVWSVRPDAPDQPEAVLQDVQAQGPFDFSSDGTSMLFASPRGGNFEVYVVELSEAGKQALLASRPSRTARRARHRSPRLPRPRRWSRRASLNGQSSRSAGRAVQAPAPTWSR